MHARMHTHMIFPMLTYLQHTLKNTQETGNDYFKEEESNSGMGREDDIVSTISLFTIFFSFTQVFLLSIQN